MDSGYVAIASIAGLVMIVAIVAWAGTRQQKAGYSEPPPDWRPVDADDVWSPGVLSDRQLTRLVICGLIRGMSYSQVCQAGDGRKLISFGISSYGIDLRLGYKFKTLGREFYGRRSVIDPKRINPEDWCEKNVELNCEDQQLYEANRYAVLSREYWIDIPPHSFVLAEALEHVEIPADCIAVALGKSTYARVGIIVNVTPIEPGWKGIITIEISNTTDAAVRVYAGEGIMQLLFLKGSEPCLTSYATRKGKYQDQKGVTEAIV